MSIRSRIDLWLHKKKWPRIIVGYFSDADNPVPMPRTRWATLREARRIRRFNAAFAEACRRQDERLKGTVFERSPR